jgi:hypothetical protein
VATRASGSSSDTAARRIRTSGDPRLAVLCIGILLLRAHRGQARPVSPPPMRYVHHSTMNIRNVFAAPGRN